MGPLEEFLSTTLIPALTGRPPPDTTVRNLFALPTRLGGLAIVNPMKLCLLEHVASIAIAGPLVTQISAQCDEYSYECIAAQISAKSKQKSSRRTQERETASAIKDQLQGPMQRAMTWLKKRVPQAG